MTVQIQPAKPKDEHNGLVDLESELLAHPEQEVVAIVTYGVAKVVDDKKKREIYPVIYVKHIEPVLSDAAVKDARELQRQAYQSRTGENELDFDSLDDDEEEGPTGRTLYAVGDDDEDEGDDE